MLQNMLKNTGRYLVLNEFLVDTLESSTEKVESDRAGALRHHREEKSRQSTYS